MCRSQYLGPLRAVEKAKPEGEVGSVSIIEGGRAHWLSTAKAESEVGSVSIIESGAVRIGCRLKSGGNAGRPARAHLIRMLSDGRSAAEFRRKLNRRRRRGCIATDAYVLRFGGVTSISTLRLGARRKRLRRRRQQGTFRDANAPIAALHTTRGHRVATPPRTLVVTLNAHLRPVDHAQRLCVCRARRSNDIPSLASLS